MSGRGGGGGGVLFQAEDGIRDLVRSRGLGDVYKRQPSVARGWYPQVLQCNDGRPLLVLNEPEEIGQAEFCLLYTSDAADERSSVDLGGRRIIKKKNKRGQADHPTVEQNK